MKKVWKSIIAALLVLVVVVFSVMNTEAVALNFGFKSVTGPLIYVLLATFFAGVLVTLLIWLPASFGSVRTAKKLQAELDKQHETTKEQIEKEVATNQERQNKEWDAKEATFQQELNELRSELVIKEQKISELEMALEKTPPLYNKETPK